LAHSYKHADWFKYIRKKYGGRGEKRKGYLRLNYCSSFQTMLNQTAIIASTGESFPFDFNLQDVNHNIEVEISPGKYDNEHLFIQVY